jgi:hypothetical protein
LVDRLKRAIGAHQMRTGDTVTYKELGELADLTPSSMTDVINAKRKVTIAEAVLWADKLGVEFAWLAANRGPMTVLTTEDARKFGQAPSGGESAADHFTRRRAETEGKRPHKGR